MVQSSTYRRQLHELALDQYGFVTTSNALSLGVPAVELRKLAHRGGLQHVAYGLYRFDDIPHTHRDEFMEAVLRVGVDAYLSHDAVLALHNLALVNPRRIRVGTPHRARPQIPDHIEIIQRELLTADLTIHEGIPTTTVAKALVDCQGIIMTDRLIDAAKQAESSGLIRKSEAKLVMTTLGVLA